MVRPGHALPELLMALTVLGVTLLPVAATTLLGARRVADSAARQTAVMEAAGLLDSLRFSGVPAPGVGVRAGGGVLRWAVDSTRHGPVIRVAAHDPTGARVLEIGASPVPGLRVLPSDTSGSGGSP